MKFKGAIFDMDGTLLNSMFVWKDVGSNYLRENNIEPEIDFEDKIKNFTIYQAIEYMQQKYNLTKSVNEVLAQMNAIVKSGYENDAFVKDGVIEMLDKCKQNKIKMCIATATNIDLAMVGLKSSGLDKYFDKIFTCAEVGSNKENATIYEEALKYLTLAKEDVIVFEDALHAVKTAKGANFRVCGVYEEIFCDDWDEIKQICDYNIASFSDLVIE